MIVTIADGRTFDTDKALTAPERHILQKLLIWEEFAFSIEQFRRKKREALRSGWNNSGEIKESENLRAILADLERKVILRLEKASG